MAEGNPGSSLRTDVFQRRSNFDPLTTVEQNDHVGAAAYLMKRAVAAVAVGAPPDGIPVIVSGSRDGTVRVSGLADGTPVAPPLDLPESVSGVAVHGNVIVTAAGIDIAVHQPALPRPMR
jgi:hypothetical protein